MKQIVFVCLLFILTHSLFAQSNEKGLKISLQTDLVAYTTAGGWSIWGVVQHHQNKMSLAYVNFSNRYRETYDDTGIEELDRFARIQFFLPQSGIMLPDVTRELIQDDNGNPVLKFFNAQLQSIRYLAKK